MIRGVDLNSGAIDVGQAGSGEVKSWTKSIPVTKSGYLYVYCSNESKNQDVYFDNLQLIVNASPILEETHYYPFGLTMAGISSKAPGRLQNRYKFNDGSELQSGEFSDGSGLELYATDFRSLDPQIGRFWQIDKLADEFYDLSPYCFAANNPISINDPSGLDTLVVVGKNNSGEDVYTDPDAKLPEVIVSSGGKKPQPVVRTANASAIIQGMVLVLLADDVTVIGAADDVLIPVLEAINGALIIWDWLKSSSDEEKIVIDDRNRQHIFKDQEGHFTEDNKDNREELENVANDPKNKLGTDKHGTDWYAKLRSDGKQVWVQVREGKIRNGGVNEVPKFYDKQTGLSRNTRP